MNKSATVIDASEFSALTEEQMRNSVYIAVMLALLVPPFIGGSLMGMMGFFPMPEFYLVFLNYSGVYVAIVFVVISSQIPRWQQKIVELTLLDHNEAQVLAQRVFARLPVYLFSAVTIYSIFGVLSANLSIQQMGLRNYTLLDHLYNEFGAIPVVLITSFPIFFFFVDRLGRYLGPRGIYVTAIPLWMKLFMLGIVTPLLIDSLLIGYYYNRTGYFELETLALWVSLLMLAAGGTWVAWRSLRQSMAPLVGFIGAYSDPASGAINQRLTPLSLDELGILTAQYDSLLVSQKRLSDSLKKERDFATRLVNTAPMIVLLLDPRGHIQYVNPYFEQLTGYALNEIIGKEWFSAFLPVRDQDHVRELFIKASHDVPTKGNTNPIVIRNGEEREIEWHDHVTRNEQGVITGLLAVGQDVTDRKINELELNKYREHLEEIVKDRSRELQDAHEQLVLKERLATLGQLTATVSHELRNPLGAMRPSLYIIKKSTDKSNGQIQKAIEIVERNVERCDQIVDELLNFTRTNKLDTYPVRIDDWLMKIIDEQNIMDDIRVEKEFCLKDVMLNIDSESLRRAVINVVENACQSMLDEELYNRPRQGSCLNIKTGVNNKRIEIIVTDNGIGMQESVLERIFEPLFSTKTYGVGLGMPTIRKIMQQHHGDIEVDTAVGHGTKVTLWLPGNIIEEH